MSTSLWNSIRAEKGSSWFTTEKASIITLSLVSFDIQKYSAKFTSVSSAFKMIIWLPIKSLSSLGLFIEASSPKTQCDSNFKNLRNLVLF